jgi:hypothetical protein
MIVKEEFEGGNLLYSKNILNISLEKSWKSRTLPETLESLFSDYFQGAEFSGRNTSAQYVPLRFMQPEDLVLCP